MSKFELFLPQSSGPHPLICITPLLGRLLFLEDLFLERRFARFFAANGLAAAVIERPIFEFDSNRGLEQIQHYLDESVSRNKWALDHLTQKKEIDPKRVGTYGISFGAIVNSLWAAQDKRLKAHVFALPGGNLAEIFLTSRDPLMRSYIRAISKHTGLKGGDLKEAFQKILRNDPLEAARSIPKQSVCLHLALFDRVVQFRYGLALWKALGKPQTIFIPLGHYSSLAAIPFLKPQVLRFFRERL